MSGEYVIDPANLASESTWMAYKDQQNTIRGQVGVAYHAITVALGMYAQFAQRLGTGGDLAPVAEYHQVRSAGVLDAEAALLGHMQAAVAIVRAMQAGATEYELFPGVPRQVQAQAAEMATQTQAADFPLLG